MGHRYASTYTVVMSEDARAGQGEELHALPRHLSALIGSLRGPADLARNHDKYLTYPDREEAGGAASASRERGQPMSGYVKWDRAVYIERMGGPEAAEQRGKAAESQSPAPRTAKETGLTFWSFEGVEPLRQAPGPGYGR